MPIMKSNNFDKKEDVHAGRALFEIELSLRSNTTVTAKLNINKNDTARIERCVGKDESALALKLQQ